MAHRIPLEIINHILMFREPHPTASMISTYAEDMAIRAYEDWGGSYPDYAEDEEGELTIDEILDRTLYENAVDAGGLKVWFKIEDDEDDDSL